MELGTIKWLMTKFPFMQSLTSADQDRFLRSFTFPVLRAGQVAYEFGAPCTNYLMCIEGRTRVFRSDERGREMLLYKVENGGTCVLTTQCLLSRSNFPAESIAETETSLMAMSASSFYAFMDEIPPFHAFVMADYTKLLSAVFSLVYSLAFESLEQRLARHLLAEAGGDMVVNKTHQQLAMDIGSVREMVSRHLGEWEHNAWIQTARGKVFILDRTALASLHAT